MPPLEQPRPAWAKHDAGLHEQLAAWLDSHAPAGLHDSADWGAMHIPGGRNDSHSDIASAIRSPLFATWEDILVNAGLVCAQWPPEYGGSGLDRLQVAVVEETFAERGLPRVRRGMGETLVGPAVLQHGTADQKEAFLPRIVAGLDVYCQGFSEPDAGSDLAALRTRGEVDGDDLVITGHKTWTTAGDAANMMFVLCRTDTQAHRHRGLSYVLVPMSDNGITVRPIRQMTGAAEFSEEYLDSARAPLFNVIGGLSNGWHVAMTTLNHERSFRAGTQHLAYRRQFDELFDIAYGRGLVRDPVYRQRLAGVYIGIELIRYGGLRIRAELEEGRDLEAWASTSKLQASEFQQRLGELFMAFTGPEGVIRPDGPSYATTHGQDVYLASLAGTIYSGTSEVQRNIIAEKVLGMPR